MSTECNLDLPSVDAKIWNTRWDINLTVPLFLMNGTEETPLCQN